MAKYDFLIIGAGFFGATCARLLTDKGYKCIIIEKESTVGGYCSDKIIDRIIVNNYSTHVIHTNNENVWNFLNKYSKIKEVDYQVKVLNNNTYYSLPINMNSYKETYNEIYPDQIQKHLEKDIKDYGCEYKRNLEELSIYKGGFKFYINCIKGYYEKLYHTECKNLTGACIREIRNDLSYNQNYFAEKYIGIPENGYTKLIENIIGDDIDIILNTDFLKNREKFSNISNFIISTIPIDKFCNYIYGALPWISVDFELKDFTKTSKNFLGIPTVKISDPNNGLLQIDEFKWLSNPDSDKNYIMYTYPSTWSPDKNCVYSENNERSEELLQKYISFISENFDNIIFGGKQGLFRNIFIDESIQLAFDMVDDLINALEDKSDFEKMNS